MTLFDWGVISVYAVGMIALSVYLSRGQTNQDDYYVGGRDMPWWAIGISTMATQTSAISFISIPAFVALKPGGGFTWLQYELAVPLAMIVTAALLLPFFRSLDLISVYEYLELRFGSSVRYLVSAVFLVSRALGTAVALYASAIVLTVMLDLPVWMTIVMMAVFTVIYDTIGGMKAVVYSDVIQIGILMSGIVVCIFYALKVAGGLDSVLSSVHPDRLRALDFTTGLSDGGSTPFWGFVVGGLFLYTAYYGTDQSQVQRELSAKDMAGTRRSLYLNGYVRFPLTLLYAFLGLAIGGVYALSPEYQQQVPREFLDFLVPVFILEYLPQGVRGLLVAALLAASMSSLDSALNSLSAASMRDFIEKRFTLSVRQALWLGKGMTVFWGCLIAAFALVVGGISDTVVESINKIGSAFYGPILAAFLTGVLSQRATTVAIFTGILAGVGFNLILWVAFPDLFWMWWNLLGLLITILVTLLLGPLTRARPVEEIARYTLTGSGFLRGQRLWRPAYTFLVLYFVFMLLVMWVLHSLSMP
ncbi:MAG: sodium/solute symporter [Pseudomonadota bacterium]|nr:sodium/solute symporter [Pseudomonadota bacterium]